MKRAVTGEQMRICDNNAVKGGTSTLKLMENAGEAVAAEFLKKYGGGRVAVICGGGNNGGDGAVAARLLYEKGVLTDVYFYYSSFTPDCKTNYERLKKIPLKIYENDRNFDFKQYGYIIDALFGTGLNKPVSGIYADVIGAVNESGANILSVDVPSGLGDGVKGIAVKAGTTVTVTAYKYSQLLGGRNFCGDIIVRDIGIAVNCGAYVYEDADIKKFFPKRDIDTHKGSYGRLCIIAGSGRYSGAAVISYNAAAALRVGAGLVTLAVPAFLADTYRKHIKESVLEYFPDNGENSLYDGQVLNRIMQSGDVICAGMGMGNNEETYKICRELLKNYDKKVLIDADGLNALAACGKDVLKNKKCEVIITPHIKEFSRLSGINTEEILENPLRCAREFAAQYGVTVLLKGASSVITDGAADVINVTGTPAMAKAGSGDALSGIIGGIAAQGHGIFGSAAAGAYIHGRAGEIAARKNGEYSVLASDICDNISGAILSVM